MVLAALDKHKDKTLLHQLSLNFDSSLISLNFVIKKIEMQRESEKEYSKLSFISPTACAVYSHFIFIVRIFIWIYSIK